MRGALMLTGDQIEEWDQPEIDAAVEPAGAGDVHLTSGGYPIARLRRAAIPSLVVALVAELKRDDGR